METLKINYNINKSELCEIGKYFDTDKTSQRRDVTNNRHCHPYTLFYNGLFESSKNNKLQVAEFGLSYGYSLLMWREYFINSNIYGFDNNLNLINNFKNIYNNERIILSQININQKNTIENCFSNLNVMFDIIIEDITYNIDEQINIIESVYKYLKPGGILIIEDIFKSYDENEYIKKLNPILQNFQDYYFLEFDHNNRNSTGLNNDKLFVLIKAGGEPIFKNNNKITIITPSYRINNLISIKNTINFDYVNEWIIVYDGNKIEKNPNLFNDNNKIKEYVYKGDGISGNPQRNYALSTIKNNDTFIYYLDDDNIIHPSLYKLLKIIDKNKVYTFNQYEGNKLIGNNINVSKIDTAMFIIDYNLCKDIKWINHLFDADGYYIKECYERNKNKHIFVDNELCYYNEITKVK